MGLYFDRAKLGPAKTGRRFGLPTNTLPCGDVDFLVWADHMESRERGLCIDLQSFYDTSEVQCPAFTFDYLFLVL